MRTDLEIQRAAVEKLQNELPYSSQRVKVTVKDAWLAVEGTLEWSYQLDRAIRAICTVIGVIGVSNDIVLTPSTAASDVKYKIEEALKRSAELDTRRVPIDSASSRAAVRCNVRYWAEREEA